MAGLSIVVVSPEVVPFAKTGGLADVAGALPRAWAALGARPSVFLPAYRKVRATTPGLKREAATVRVPILDRTVEAGILRGTLPDSKVPAFFIDAPEFFDREELYGTPKGDYPDNASRFTFFARAVLEAVRALDLRPDVIHAHDWQAALVPVYLKTLYAQDPILATTRSALTIHNLGYQGLFWHWDMKITGLDWRWFHWKALEYFGKVNFLKGGIVFADLITTVSPTYAREILEEETGVGLGGVLRERAGDLRGILNGIDADGWDPARDPLLPEHYSARDLRGKAACKAHLQRAMGLAPRPDVPLFGMVSRLTDQKGWDLLAAVVPDLAERDVQFAILGAGEEKYVSLLKALQARHPDRVGVQIGFDERRAHEIEAGADFFLMPSRYEPCGLNQMYSLRYGTLPVVRRTGGLADTVSDYSPERLRASACDGFVFRPPDPSALREAIERALVVYRDPKALRRMRETAMARDFSWARSARAYLAAFQAAVRRPVPALA